MLLYKFLLCAAALLAIAPPNSAISLSQILKLLTGRGVSSQIGRRAPDDGGIEAKLKKYKIVPNVIAKAPKNVITIKYGKESVDLGNLLAPLKVEEKPTTISWPAKKDVFYTLIMQEPDVPPMPGSDRKEPREGQHWLVVNIPGKDVAKGETIFEYIGAAPAKGDTHKFVFIVYPQKKKLDKSEYASYKDEEGGSINIRKTVTLKDIVKKLKLEDPLAVNFFRSKFDESTMELAKEFLEEYSVDDGTLAEKLKKAKIVPNVIPKPPKTVIAVKYGKEVVDLGNTLTPTQTHKKPTFISWSAESGAFYTLILQEPDVPPVPGTKEKSTSKEGQHWLVVNIPGKDVSKGETLLEYLGAAPPKGDLHKYIFLVYKQKKKVDKLDYASFTDDEGGSIHLRKTILLKNVVEKLNLGVPHAINFFLAQFDENTPKYTKELKKEFA